MSEKSEILPIKMDGKNYFSWVFQFRMFVKGKELWGHIDESIPKPTQNAEKAKWESNDAKVITWILSSVDSKIVLNLRSYTCAKDMWAYLKKIYNQDNPARRFQLELDISEYSQGTMSIQEYYSGFIIIWAEYKELVYANVSIEGLKTLQAVHEITQRDQFLMKLRHEFEPVRSNLMSRAPTPSLETSLSELLRDEQRCLTQAALEQKDIGSNPLDAAFVTQARGKDVSTKQCYSCKEFGHIAINCKKKYCNYCKKPGHLITECRRRPQIRSLNAFYAAPAEGSYMVPNALYAAPVHTSTTSSAMTPEVVQQMIQSAFSAFCLKGKTTSSPVWYVDSGASNHMTFSSAQLANIKPYMGNLQIQTANGEVVPIKAMGDIPHTLPLHNVFHTPRLASNLISVGQLVDDNCNVSFSKSGCIMQDQASGKVIGKGPKCGIKDWGILMPKNCCSC
ncbi:hypothetical protein RHSIM_Rhsim05G0128700 [Rhododendron simsii]|uniref:CCHC-type domain-containing protein n=1 Tax=Rhododendron simsii TaxID=118357 RepID=A0A834H8Z9_RHOSS|nr:hypothetical protein RHSIM_Rhsim05G0128700 [Rhododendron simsii]